jgi:hypothetical protein
VTFATTCAIGFTFDPVLVTRSGSTEPAQMERSPLASSSVASAGYDEGTLVLEIEFTSGRIYQFEGVPRGVFDWLLRTPNKGSYVARMINNKYAYRDVTLGTEGEGEAESDDILEKLRDSVRWLEDKNPSR